MRIFKRRKKWVVFLLLNSICQLADIFPFQQKSGEFAKNNLMISIRQIRNKNLMIVELV